MLKKCELHDRTGQPVVDRDTPSRVKSRTCWGQFIEYTTIGLCISGHGAAEVDVNLTEEVGHAETNPMCEIHKGYIARHSEIRDQNPSLGKICPGEPHERSPNAPKFEDRYQEETEWQEQGAREAAWKLAKSVLKLKEHQRATFFSPSENRCLLASNLKPEEREELEKFLTMKVLENTPAVLSLGKLCDENVYSYERTNGQKPHKRD